MKKEYFVIGGMAGSSMDGLDLAAVKFSFRNHGWIFDLVACDTVAYPNELFHQLKHAISASTIEKESLDHEFGRWIANQIRSFTDFQHADLVSMHGHTIEHNPDKGISWQLGSGETIADALGTPTVTDFRSQDIELGGQGAPLVPFGDFALFREYDACLNLGGIANISIRAAGIAGDLCPCNQVLNYYAGRLGHDFDDQGRLAEQGRLVVGLLNQLTKDPFFEKSFPKSLPNHYLKEDLLGSVHPKDGLRTYSELIAMQVATSLTGTSNKGKLLITGGGAFNQFLVQSIRKKLPHWEIHVPSTELVSFKEAIIFAFLGLKKQMNEVNVLSTVTGAKHDTSSGVIHIPK